jgi:hypothetical protein
MSTGKQLFLAGLLLIVGLFVTPSTLAQGPYPTGNKAPFVQGEILVKFKPHVGGLGAQRSLEAEGLQTLEVSKSGYMRVRVPPGFEEATIARLQARGDIEIASVNHLLYAAVIPNDPSYGTQWALPKINAPVAWDITTGSSNVIVAVVDSGLDTGHVEFSGRIVDPYDAIDGDSTPQDTCGHGTHVTGIIGAAGNNSTGMAGMAWNIKVMPIRALTLNGSCGGNEFDVQEAIDWAVSHGAKVINLSLGALPGVGQSCQNFLPTLSQAVTNAYNAGVLVVAAAGNNGADRLACPAAQAETLAVGATTSSDQRSWYSNYGTGLNVMAPGDGIYSTIPGSYTYMSGTSMATPHVSGLAGLIFSVNSSLSHTGVWNIIQNTADDLSPSGYDTETGYGRINAGQALESVTLASSIDKPFLLIDDYEPPQTSNLQITTLSSNPITWTTAISPGASWLSVTPPESGGISSSSSPINVTLVATRPITYGAYSATVVVTGTTTSGAVIGPTFNQVQISYVSKLAKYWFPIMFK